MPDRPRLHLDYLDGIRALTALFVVAGHGWLTVWSTASELPGERLHNWTTVLVHGHFAVGVFIVISGFCLALPVVRGDAPTRVETLAFLRRRARRILPPYYCALALSLLLATTIVAQPTGTHWDVSVPVHAAGVVGTALMLQDVVGFGQVNHAFWSIAVEWKIYLLFPLMLLLWRRAGAFALVAGATIVGLALASLVHGTRLEGLTPQYLALFVFGALGAATAFRERGAFPRIRRALPWRAILATLTATIVALFWIQGWQWVFAHKALCDLLVGAWAAVLLTACSPTVGGAQRVACALAARPLVWLGSFAYSIYLVHAPLLQVAWQYGIHPHVASNALTFVALVGLAMPAIVACSYLFYLACERPFVTTASRARPRDPLVPRVARRRTAQVAVEDVAAP